MTNAPAKSDTFKVANVNGGTSRMELSKQWMSRRPDEKFLNLSSLYKDAKDSADRRTELVMSPKKLRIIAPPPVVLADSHMLFAVTEDGRELPPTNWAFGQICTAAKAPASYLRRMPSQIVGPALSYNLKYGTGQNVKLYADEEQLFAATGESYGRIHDYEVAEAVMQIAGNGTGDTNWKIPGVMNWSNHIYDPHHPVTLDTTTLFRSDRDFFIFLVDDLNPIVIGKLPNGDDDIVFRGFYVTNSEMGKSSLKIAVFYLRAICCNRIMWGVEGFEEITMRHSKYAPARFIEEAVPALRSFTQGSVTKLIDGVAKAKAAVLADRDEDMVSFLRDLDLSQERVAAIMEAVEREEQHPARTVWDVAQGITAVARNVPNNDDRVELEGEARKLLDKVA